MGNVRKIARYFPIWYREGYYESFTKKGDLEVNWLIGIAIVVGVLVAFVLLIKIVIIPAIIAYLKKRAIDYAKKHVADIAAPLAKKAVDNATQYAKDQIQNLTEKKDEESK